MPNILERLIEEEENKTQRQISKAYNDALQESLRKTKEFFKKARDVETGKIKPPSSYKTQAQIDGWKRAYMTRAAKKASVVEQISDAMKSAGVKTRARLQQSMMRVYEKTRKATGQLLTKRLPADIPEMSRRKIQVLLYGKNSNRPFSKIAYHRLAVAKDASSKLRQELAQGIAKGEGRDQLLKRVMKVTGAEEKDALRILRTESTQVESMAQMDVMDEVYHQTGKKPWKRWNCVFVNSRDTHMEMHGQEVPYDEPFHSPSGALLMYPGDNNAPAEEIVNCQCYMEVFDKWV